MSALGGDRRYSIRRSRAETLATLRRSIFILNPRLSLGVSQPENLPGWNRWLSRTEPPRGKSSDGFQPLLLSRLQFAFDLLPYHLSVLHHRARRMAGDPGRPAAGDRQTESTADLRLLAQDIRLSFGLGVVSGMVMAFQFGTNWSGLAEPPARSRGRCWPTKASPPSPWKPHFSAC